MTTPSTCSHREKNGKIELRAFLGRDPATGKPVYRSRTVEKMGIRALNAAKAEFLAELAEEGDSFATAETFGALLDAWMRQGATRWSPSTVRGYQSHIKNHIRPALGEKKLSQIKAKTLDDHYRKLLEKIGPKTIRQVHAICHAALKQAVRWEWLPANPADNASPPSVPKVTHQPPPIDELAAAIREYADIDPDMTTCWWLSAAMGTRRGETLAIRWKDVDLDAGTVLIHRAIVVGTDLAGRKFTSERETKTHAARTIEIDAVTVLILRTHLQRCVKRVAAARGVSPVPQVLPTDAFLFSPSADGLTFYQDPGRVGAAWRRWRAQKGLDHVRLHDLRHVTATTLLNAGVPIHTVSKRLGHALVSTTLDIYGHAVPGSGRDAATKMGELMGGALELPPADEEDVA